MTSPRYGFMQEVEADLIDRLLDRIVAQFGEVRFLEIGVFSGDTARGIVRWSKEMSQVPVFASGVDFEQYRPNPTPLPDYDFHACDSMDAWREIPTDSKYGLLFIDGCHCVNHTICDFSNYSPFVVLNGYVLFHDTAVPTNQFEQEPWPQDHSYAGVKQSKLGVREGMKKLGLLQGYRSDWKFIEEIPSDTGLMGAMLFQKVAEL